MVRSRFARFLTLLFAAIQFAAPAAASVAEGNFARLSVDSRAHVEEHGQKDCAPPHSADCAVCRYLVDNVGSASAPATLVAILAAQAHPVVSVRLGATAERQGFDARGPPAIAG